MSHIIPEIEVEIETTVLGGLPVTVVANVTSIEGDQLELGELHFYNKRGQQLEFISDRLTDGERQAAIKELARVYWEYRLSTVSVH